MSQPWDPDHGLSRAELAERLVRSLTGGRFDGSPRFGPRPEVEWFDEGWDCDVFLVDDSDGVPWLCKLPKRAQVQAWIRKEAGILGSIAEAGLGLAPRLGLRGEAGELPYEWIGISIAPGKSLLRNIDRISPAILGGSYGNLLRFLHRLEPDVLGRRPATGAHKVDALVADAGRAIGALRRHVAPSLVSAVEAMVARAGAHEPEEAPVAFLHGDLFPEHVFLDLGTSEVLGFIDWADATWGDPANDFCLIGWILGDDFLDAAVAAYGSDDPESLKQRAVRYGTMVGIFDIEAAERGAPNVPLEQRIEVLRKRAAEGWLDRI